MKPFLLPILAGTAAFFAPTIAFAGSCQGVVSGLFATYNKAKGTGFLAVRQKPTAKSRQRGELFNGDLVEVSRRQGRDWIYVSIDKTEGWVFQRYVRRECDGI